MTDVGHSPESQRSDCAICGVAMVLCAIAVSLANIVNLQNHLGMAVCTLTLGMASCAVAIMLPSIRRVMFGQRGLAVLIGLAVGIQAWALKPEITANVIFSCCLLAIALLEVLSLPGRINRQALLWGMAAGFFLTAAITIHRPTGMWTDVLMSEQKGCEFLLKGLNPYTAKYPNIYGPNTPLYAAGMIDSTNHLTFGYPYPPLSLLMDVPSYLLTGDVRYGIAAALALSAVLIGLAGEGRLGILAAAALLAAPLWPWILRVGWIEPLVIFNFSLTMFCACRWRRGLPWALGLFLSTKQYAILALPLLPLLLNSSGNDSAGNQEKWFGSLCKTALIMACINLPFFLMNPSAFLRSTLWVHAAQAFRPDALSYSAWLYRHTGHTILPGWVALLAMGIAFAEALRRGVRSPAGFAAALTLVLLVFFAFNKQAFCNYYYFMIASAWWSVAAARLPVAETATDRFKFFSWPSLLSLFRPSVRGHKAALVIPSH